MSYASLLINFCKVERYVLDGLFDAYGKPTGNWTLVFDGEEPCRLMSAKGKELTIGAEVVVADYKVFLRDLAVTEQDRIYIYSEGVWVGPYEILSVNNIQDGVASHHKECYLKISR